MAILPNSMSYENLEVVPDEVLEDYDFFEYAYDFENNELLTDSQNKHYYVYGNEAMKIWIYKCMLTSRFKYTAYSDRFGTEVFELVGEVISSKLKKEEIKRYITEAIMVHPFMVSITKIDIEQKRENVTVVVYYTTVFSDEVVKVECQVPIE